MRLILTLFRMFLILLTTYIMVLFTLGFTVALRDENIGNSNINFFILLFISIALIYKLGKFILSIGRDTEESIF